jgi:DNA-binding XRE family transcriptional regulator
MEINANGELSIDQKKDYAKTLYLRDEYTQKDIAEKVGISEKTMSLWVNENHWEALRKSITVTKAEQLSLLYDIMDHLNREAKKFLEDDDPATNPNYDAIAKVSKSIERLEKDAGVGEMIQAVIELTKFAQKEDLGAAKVIEHWGYLFIQDKMKTAK